MFDHADFDHFAFADIPIGRDLFLLDEKDMEVHEREWLAFFDGGAYDPSPLVSYVAVGASTDAYLELSWFTNVYTRFHEVKVVLPKHAFVRCVGCRKWDGRPCIFVRSEWLRQLYTRGYSIFGLVDAIGVENALRSGAIGRSDFVQLRGVVDHIASRFEQVSFVSFADSILLKSNWWAGHVELAQQYRYEPELLVTVSAELDAAYRRTVGLATYAILVQGSNEFFDDSLLHTSPSGNHVSLNSLGLPFAQLQAIDSAARTALKSGLHPPSELYIDSDLLHSLNLQHGFDRDSLAIGSYQTKMMLGAGKYYAVSRAHILDNLTAR